MGSALSWQSQGRDLSQPFDEIELFLEANVLDEDSEIVLLVETYLPMKRLMLRDPFQRVVYDMTFDAPGGLGSSEVRVESGEPTLETTLKAFPEGWYGVSALTIDNQRVTGSVYLSHGLPSRFGILSPLPDQMVDVGETQLRWSTSMNIESFTIEVETGEDHKSMIITVPGNVTEFQIPPVLLQTGLEHQLVITANGTDGNKVVQEQNFRTYPHAAGRD